MNTQNSKNLINTDIVLPVVVTKNILAGNEKWEVDFYEEYTPAFFENTGVWKKEFVERIGKHIGLTLKANFRNLIIIESVPFLAGFFFDEKRVCLCSHRASRELFLIEEIEKHCAERDNEGISYNYNNNDFEKLKSRVNKVVSLDSKTFPTQIEKITDLNQLPDLLHGNEFLKVNKASRGIIERLLKELNDYKPSIFEKLTDFSLNLVANSLLLRVHLLKFLAILPSLDFDVKGKEVKRIFLEAMRRLSDDSRFAEINNRQGEQKPLSCCLLIIFRLLSVGTRLMPAGLFAFFARRIVKLFARRFIAGETIEDAKESLAKLRSSGRDATIDQLGELVVSEKEADRYCENVIKLVRGLSTQIKRGEQNESGILKANVSIKVSALSSDFKPEAPDYTYASVAPRLIRIFLAAKEDEVFINVDAEHYNNRDLVFNIFKRVLLETEELKGFKSAGIVIQAYLRDAYTHFLDILNLAETRKVTMPIRLVKGAYWDAETIEADAFDFDAPEFLNKEESDIHFRQLIIMIERNYPHVQLCLASHNLQDHCFAEALRKVCFSHIPKIEHQCLYMTCEALSASMAQKMLWVTRNYVPVGSLLVGMGYLVRRIMENSSMAGILTIMRAHKNQEMVKDPAERLLEKKKEGHIVFDHSVMELSSGFVNVSPVRLYINAQRNSIARQLKKYLNGIGKTYESKIEFHGSIHDVFCPSDPGLLVGRIRFADKNDAKSAVETVSQANRQDIWGRQDPVVRSSILLKAADSMLLRRLELASLIVYEAGKSINEAIADVDEAIDFLNFYAREEVFYSEKNRHAIPRGVFTVVSPWNFPLSIPCGMTVAALVAGNTVLLKSSTQTPLIAQVMVDILHHAGVPDDVLIHVPGSGCDVGSILIKDQMVQGIVFTGSKEIGIWIADQVEKRVTISAWDEKLRYSTRVITEMGGKNAIIVTANAELDETVSSVLYSCFGHAGQKCSAASRILVDERILQRFVSRFSEACYDISVGESYKFDSTINPVISIADKQRLIREGREACKEALNFGGKVLVNRIDEELPGCCVGPLVIQLPASRALSKDSYSRKELFGPIAHAIPYQTIDQAVRIVNSSEYALTAGVFSQSQDDIDYIVKRIEAGNIYVNRGCTGARVSIEPFGGFKLSGTGPKAGHREYLEAFHLMPHKDHVLLMKNVSNRLTAEQTNNLYALAKKSQTEVNDRIRILKTGVFKLEKVFGNTTDLNIKNGDLSEGFNRFGISDLKEFNTWLESNINNFLFARHPNRNIQGQLSYNNHEMIKEQGLLLAYNEQPYISSLINMMAAIAVGSGVTILASSEEAYSSWKLIHGCFVNACIPMENLNIYFVNNDIIIKALTEPDISFIIIDGTIDKIQKIPYTFSSMSNGNSKYMRSIHTPMDSPEHPQWEKFLLQFVFTRSFAINTMRHGAPLELGL